MIRVRRSFLVALLTLAAAGAWAAAAGAGEYDYHSPRQYYSSWEKSPSADYYYREYYYKPSDDYAGYKHHYVILHKADPKHVYYYNPYKKAYWGRCDVYGEGKPAYSQLAPEYRKSTLKEIPESAFPAPSKVPPIPESADNVPLDLPPDDVPQGFSTASPAAAVAPPKS